jgi:hypothetical protein
MVWGVYGNPERIVPRRTKLRNGQADEANGQIEDLADDRTDIAAVVN